MWYAKRMPIFNEITEDYPRLDVARVPASAQTPPCLKLSQKLIGTDAIAAIEKMKMEYIRLSLPVKCTKSFTRRDKDTLHRQLEDAQRRGMATSRQQQQERLARELSAEESMAGEKKVRSAKGKMFLSAFRRGSQDEEDGGKHGKSKGSSFDSSYNDTLADPPAVT